MRTSRKSNVTGWLSWKSIYCLLGYFSVTLTFHNDATGNKYLHKILRALELIRCSLRYLPFFHPKPQCSRASCFKDWTVFVTFWQMVAEKVKGTHGVHCRGINPVENPRVSTVDPVGRDATKGFFELSKPQRETPPPPPLQVWIPWKTAPSLEMPTSDSFTYRLPGVHSVPHTLRGKLI